MQLEVKQMVESIIRGLVQSMQAETAAPPRVLYIFCDSTAHEAFTDHFILLGNYGICHDILFLDGESSSWLGKHKIECGGPGKIITADEYAPAPLEVPMAYVGIVIPEIDLDNAARAARGLKGTVKSEIIFSSLVLNKFVLIGDDAQGLKRADRRTLKTLSLPASYADLFQQYKRELTLLGAEFAPQKQLAEVVVRKCAPTAAVPRGDAEPVPDLDNVVSHPLSDALAAADVRGDKASPESSVFEGRLVSAQWVQQQVSIKSLERLILGRDTLVSPLAKDLLRQSGVKVQYIDEG